MNLALIPLLIMGIGAGSYYLYLHFTGLPVGSPEAANFLLYVISACVAAFFMTVTYVSWFKKGSGTPLMGALIMLIGGLLFAPTKWLCLLALLDPVFVYYLPPIRKRLEAKQSAKKDNL